MSELVEYFTRHYTLVLDNDQGPYNACRRAARDACQEEVPDLTAAEYRAMPEHERNSTFAAAIGANILALIEEWADEVLDAHDDTIGALLIREVLITNGHDIAWSLGEHYMPEDADADEFFAADDDEYDTDDPSRDPLPVGWTMPGRAPVVRPVARDEIEPVLRASVDRARAARDLP